MIVTKQDIVKDFANLGIRPTDAIMVHSSMKSFGYVDGGPQTIIEGLKEVVKDGTLCFPALRMHEVYNAYADWDIEKTPTGVGRIAETFRTSKGVLRSDQETHSVTAIGKLAKYITEGHRTGKERVCIYGNLAFGYNSPWQRLYDLNAKVVLIGVSMVYNTFKHFVETCLADDILSKLSQEDRVKAESELSNFSSLTPLKYGESLSVNWKPKGVWFWHDGQKAQDKMQELGLLTFGKCGNANLICFSVRQYFEFMYRELRFNSKEWLDETAVEWIKKYDSEEKCYDY